MTVTDFSASRFCSSLHHCVQFLICNLKNTFSSSDPVQYETPLNSSSYRWMSLQQGDTLFRQEEFALLSVFAEKSTQSLVQTIELITGIKARWDFSDTPSLPDVSHSMHHLRDQHIPIWRILKV